MTGGLSDFLLARVADHEAGAKAWGDVCRTAHGPAGAGIRAVSEFIGGASFRTRRVRSEATDR